MKTHRSISALLLALLVLVSSTSFIIGMHFCMGEVQHIALFTKADGCEKAQNLPPCHRHLKEPCCSDETVVHTGEDFKASVNHIQIDVPAPLDIEQPLVLIAEVIPSSPLSRNHYHIYDPPLRSLDLTVRHQVFLI